MNTLLFYLGYFKTVFWAHFMCTHICFNNSRKQSLVDKPLEYVEQFVDNKVAAIEIHFQVCSHNIVLLVLWHTLSHPKQTQ